MISFGFAVPSVGHLALRSKALTWGTEPKQELWVRMDLYSLSPCLPAELRGARVRTAGIRQRWLLPALARGQQPREGLTRISCSWWHTSSRTVWNF